MNQGLYGFSKPPATSLRIAPPEWRSYKLITETTSEEVVPQNVYQIKVMVWGAGDAGVVGNYPGAGGGFAEAIIDVVPGQLLPTITVGTTAGSTSSFGALISATGGSVRVGGAGTVSPGPRGAMTCNGGSVPNSASAGGAASGSPYGLPETLVSGNTGGGAWGNKVTGSSSANGHSTPVSNVFTSESGFLALINHRALPGLGATDATTQPGFGCGQYSQPDATTSLPSPFGGGGAFGGNKGGRGALGGGGGGGSNTVLGAPGPGCVILAWTEGY